MMCHSLAIVVALGLAACTTPSDDTSVASGAEQPAHSLQAVAGHWTFSHAGSPSVSSRNTRKVAPLVKEKMSGTEISIEPDGSASMIALGESGSFKVEVLEETPLYIKIGSRSAPPQKAWTYEKRSGLLIIPMSVDDAGKKGTMPIYFRRRAS